MLYDEKNVIPLYVKHIKLKDYEEDSISYRCGHVGGEWV